MKLPHEDEFVGIDYSRLDHQLLLPRLHNFQSQNSNDIPVEGFDIASISGFYNATRANYLQNLIPWVKSAFFVDAKKFRRAFAGLSLGGDLTLTMLFNATDTFSHYCVMSTSPSPPAGNAQYSNPALKQVGIFSGVGFYKLAFQNTRNFEDRLTGAELEYLSHYPANSAHQWSTWQQILYVFLKDAIWKSVPYTFST